jgi:hypothetical protein
MDSWSFVPEDNKGYVSKGSILGWELKTPSSFLGQQNIENDNNQCFEELGFHGMLGKQLSNVVVVDDVVDDVVNDDVVDDVVVDDVHRRKMDNDVVMAAPRREFSNSLGCNSLIDLKLGRFGDHKDAIGNAFSKGTAILSSSGSSSTPPKRVRSSSIHSQIAYCQVYGCNKDLSGCKDYHKRHKVCEIHSKTSKVIVNGIEQRFCQQCSRLVNFIISYCFVSNLCVCKLLLI